MDRSVLLIDDDTAVLGMLEAAFRRAGYSVMAASSGELGVETYSHDATDLVVLDLKLPDISGLEVLRRLRDVNPGVTVLMLTGQADLATAVEAMREGAENFLAKPVDLQHLLAAAGRAFETAALRRRAAYLESRERSESGPRLATEASSPMAELDENVRLVAPRETTVLILGETGTGKSWTARRIHGLSPRAEGPFVELNAAALTPTFLESELFGHEKGAFTDARTMKPGLFEVADGGTLFLDEIGDLSPQLQPKLLHVIENRRFRRIGGTREIQSDVRLIAATNRNLKEDVEEGTFREDLYYRLAVLPMTLPPLRERAGAEVEALTRTLLDQLQGQASGRRKQISPDALDRITRYPWPGNIRELRNVLERALILAGNAASIQPAHLPGEVSDGSHDRAGPANEAELRLTLHELERRHIHRVLAHCEGNRSAAARMLGISRVGLYKKLQRMETEAAG